MENCESVNIIVFFCFENVEIRTKKDHLREVLIHYFILKKTAAQTYRILVEAYGEHAPSQDTCERWFNRFKTGDFDVKDKAKGKPPKKFEDAVLQALLDEDSTQTQSQLAEVLNVTQKSVQMINLNHALITKRPEWAQRHGKVILLHDNAPAHTTKVVKETLKELNWDVLSHPPYSPDIAPSDYHLFRSMAHGLAEQHFANFEEVKKWVDSWFASKDESFYRRGIHLLPERWEKVVASNGAYFK